MIVFTLQHDSKRRFNFLTMTAMNFNNDMNYITIVTSGEYEVLHCTVSFQRSIFEVYHIFLLSFSGYFKVQIQKDILK